MRWWKVIDENGDIDKTKGRYLSDLYCGEEPIDKMIVT